MVGQKRRGDEESREEGAKRMRGKEMLEAHMDYVDGNRFRSLQLQLQLAYDERESVNKQVCFFEDLIRKSWGEEAILKRD